MKVGDLHKGEIWTDVVLPIFISPDDSWAGVTAG